MANGYKYCELKRKSKFKCVQILNSVENLNIYKATVIEKFEPWN